MIQQAMTIPEKPTLPTDLPTDLPRPADMDDNTFQEALYATLMDLARRHAPRNKSARTMARRTEMAHEMYLSLHDDPSVRSANSMRGYVAFKIPRLVIDYYKGKTRHHEVRDKAGFAPVAEHDRATDQGDVVEQLADNEQVQRLCQQLEALRETDADASAALTLQVFGGMSYKEIATELGLSAGNAGKAILRARAALRETA